MFLPIGARDYDLGWIGKRDAAVITAVLLDTNREQTLIIGLLPFFHAGIEPAHGGILEIN
jgi:hypothetical protein